MNYMRRVLGLISGDPPHPILASAICLMLISLICISDEQILDKWILDGEIAAQKEISSEDRTSLDLLGLAIFLAGGTRLAASMHMLIMAKVSEHLSRK